MLTLSCWVVRFAECIKADTYYNKNCPDGIKLDDECEEEDFCSTPYSRCMDGKCKCLPEFVPRNVTYGQAAICVPEGTASPANARDPTADICRYANPKADTQFYEVSRFATAPVTAQLASEDYYGGGSSGSSSTSITLSPAAIAALQAKYFKVRPPRPFPAVLFLSSFVAWGALPPYLASLESAPSLARLHFY